MSGRFSSEPMRRLRVQAIMGSMRRVLTLVAIASVLCLSAGCATRDKPSTDASTSHPRLGLSDRTMASFEAFGTEFRDSDEDPKVNAEEAIEASGRAFGLAKGKPAEIALGTLTVPTHGRNVSDDPSLSVIEPFIKDRLVWVVVYDSVVQPGSGPAPVADGASAPETPKETRAGLWVAVDATSGDVIRGESVGDG
jgi:hypothetical protein